MKNLVIFVLVFTAVDGVPSEDGSSIGGTG